ncbi:hypothetical protein N8475_11580, partial [Winogradskyella sp.]|nr:hypothetical protein [Winogradskyella sp.]
MNFKTIYWFLTRTEFNIIVKYLKNILINRFYVLNNKSNTKAHTFYIDIPDNVMARYLYNLVFALTNSGYNVKIKANIKLIGNLFDYSDLIL